MAYEVEHPSGDREYRDSHGRIHRVGEPAVFTSSSVKWYHEGDQHRTEGPAVIHYDGTCEWWFYGKFSYKTPVDLRITQAVVTIQRAWKLHQAHEKYKPHASGYYEALESFLEKHDKTVSQTELILPQM